MNENNTSVAHNEEGEAWQRALEVIRRDVVGRGAGVPTPFGVRPLVYADWIASGRALNEIEDYIRNQVLMTYGNTHTISSHTGQQTTAYREEARQIVAQSVNANRVKDVVIFTGTGSTAAINKFVQIVGLSSSARSTKERGVVFVGPFEHHSNLLPWRESNADVIQIRENEFGTTSLEHLKEELEKHADRPLRIGSFSAASNVTGVCENVNAVTAMLHRHGALAVWDYACAAPYLKMDMNPVLPGSDEDRAYVSKDAIFFSPHKFVGGVSTPGVLVMKKALLENPVPATPHIGGGTVFFVTPESHRYLSSREDREEGGTPDIVGSIRVGLAFQAKNAVGIENIERIQAQLWEQARVALGKCGNIVLLGPLSQARLPVLSFLVRYESKRSSSKEFLHHNFVAAILNDLYGIQARGGCLCAGPYVQKILGIDRENLAKIEEALVAAPHLNECLRPGVTRVSLSYVMTAEEVEYILTALRDVSEHGWRLLPWYRFNPKTGVWKHQKSFRKFVERKWLGKSTIFGLGHLFSNLGEENGSVDETVPSLAECLRAAREDILKMVDGEAAKRERMNDMTDYFPEDVAYLRWFVTPTEACNDIIASEKILEEPLSVVPPQVELKCIIRPSLYLSEQAPRFEETASCCLDTGKCSQFSSYSAIESDETLDAPATKLEKEEEAKNETAFSGCKDNKCFVVRRKDKYPIRFGDIDLMEEALVEGFSSASLAAAKLSDQMSKSTLLPSPPHKLVSSVREALWDFNMIKPGDKLLLGLSGGKDSLALLHILLALQKDSRFSFSLAAATVDPGTEAFDPTPLIPYMESLGVPYHFLKTSIFQDAAKTLQGQNNPSYCSFCARMKRGSLYGCVREHGYTTLVLAQHLDDIAESFFMSLFNMGCLKTQFANYVADSGDIRIIRPLVYVREADLKEFSYSAKLPVINENCPACFEAPKERHRMKKLLAREELALGNSLFSSLKNALLPVLDPEVFAFLREHQLKIQNKKRRPGVQKRLEEEQRQRKSKEDKSETKFTHEFQ